MRTFAAQTVFMGALFIGLLTGPIVATAQSAPDRTSVPTAAIGEINAAPVKYVYPLSKFVPTPGNLVLHDSATGSKIAVPISGRLKPKTITLTLNFTNSIALDPQTSVLSVRFNETTLAQVRLDPKSPVASARVNLPAELARRGYNTIELSLTQHTGTDCEDPEAPELWTEVNTADSLLEIDGEVTPATLRLSDLDEIFSPGVGGARRVAIVTPPLAKDAALIEAGALAAQAIALRAQYESVNLHPATIAADAAAPWMMDDQVIIGTRDEIAVLLEQGESEKITGPYLSLRSLDRRQVRLVISGKTPQDVILAARALTYMDIPIADAVSASIKGIKPSAAIQNRTLEADRVYSFEELGIPTTTLRGFGTQKILLNLPMPPDLYAPEQAALSLLLDFNYGAGSAPGSVINVEVNGKFLHGINIYNENGGAFRNYQISIPLRDLVGGPNQIAFNVIMPAVRKDRCLGASGRHLALTLFGTSSVQIPAATHIAAQPDLDLMVRTGFPYTAANGTPTTVWVSDASMLGAGWSLVGRLAQVYGAALPHLQFGVGGEPPHGPAILIGEAKTLPPRIFAATIQAVGETHRIPYRGFAGPKGVPAPSLLDRMWPLGSTTRKPDAPLPNGLVEQSNALGGNTILTAARTEGGTPGTVTVITAENREQVIAGVQKLITPQYWGQARGDFMLWRDTPDTVMTLRLSPRFHIGEEAPLMNLRFYISQNPWWWLGGTILVLMALSGLTVWLLARRRTGGE